MFKEKLTALLDKFALPILAAALLGIGVITLYLKFNFLQTWKFSSDLFNFDQVLMEIARENFGLDFTYGNMFGDHAYLLILLLLPFKLLLKDQMLYLLLSLGTLGLIFSTLVLFFTLKTRRGTVPALVATLTYLFGFGFMMPGLLENFFGFHPDTLGGFLAISFTCFLLLADQRGAQGKSRKLSIAGFLLCFILFLSLKEEFALLGCLFFIFLCLFNRSRFNIGMFIFSLFFTFGGFVFINSQQTAFNRTNSSLLAYALGKWRLHGIGFFFNNPYIPNEDNLLIWLSLLLFTLIFMAAFFSAKQKNALIAALFLCGLGKVFVGMLVIDYCFTDWHLFPGFVMLMGGTLLQLVYQNGREKRFLKMEQRLLSVLFLFSLFFFISLNLRYTWRQHLIFPQQKQVLVGLQAELHQLRAQLDPGELVSIPPMSAVEFTGQRFSFYPRGIDQPPQGSADHVIYPTNAPFKFTRGYENDLQLEELSRDFEIIDQTEHFALLKRIQVPEDQRPKREAFYQLFTQP